MEQNLTKTLTNCYISNILATAKNINNWSIMEQKIFILILKQISDNRLFYRTDNTGKMYIGDESISKDFL